MFPAIPKQTKTCVDVVSEYVKDEFICLQTFRPPNGLTFGNASFNFESLQEILFFCSAFVLRKLARKTKYYTHSSAHPHADVCCHKFAMFFLISVTCKHWCQDYLCSYFLTGNILFWNLCLDTRRVFFFLSYADLSFFWQQGLPNGSFFLKPPSKYSDIYLLKTFHFDFLFALVKIGLNNGQGSML